MQQAVQDLFELVEELDLVEQDVIHPRSRHPLFEIAQHDIGIPQLTACPVVQRSGDDVLFIDPGTHEMMAKQLKQQIRFPGPPQPRHDFDEPVLFTLDELIQVDVPFDLHVPAPAYYENMCLATVFRNKYNRRSGFGQCGGWTRSRHFYHGHTGGDKKPGPSWEARFV